MLCPKCNQLNSDGSQVCSSCGASLRPVPAGNPIQSPLPPEGKKSKVALIIIVAVLVLLGLGIAGFFVFSKLKSASSSYVPKKENITTSKSSADFNVSKNASPITEQKASYSKLTFNKMTSWYGEKEIVKDQEVEFGKKVEIYFSGVSGFKEVNGKVFPGASLTYVSTSGEEIVVSRDVFKEYDESGMSLEDAKSLMFKAIIGNPLKHGENYIIKLVIWDKKGDGKIESEFSIKTK